MSDREGYLKRRDQLLMQDERIAELEAEVEALEKVREQAQAVVESSLSWAANAENLSDEIDKLNAALEGE